MTGATSFRKRGQKTVTVYSGVEGMQDASEVTATRGEFDRIRKGMTAGDVERVLGKGDVNIDETDHEFAIVTYGKGSNSITVVYRNQRVVSKAFAGW
jgi:hypothetical protein